VYCCTNPGSSVAQTPSGSTNSRPKGLSCLTVAANELSSLQKRQIPFTSPISSAAVDSGMVTGGSASVTGGSASVTGGSASTANSSGSSGSTGKCRSAAGAGGRSSSATICMSPKHQITSTSPKRSAVSVPHSVISDLCDWLQALGTFLHATCTSSECAHVVHTKCSRPVLDRCSCNRWELTPATPQAEIKIKSSEKVDTGYRLQVRGHRQRHLCSMLNMRSTLSGNATTNASHGSLRTKSQRKNMQ
jgi:hypothetical protein